MKRKRGLFAVRATLNGRRVESDPFKDLSQAVGYAYATRKHRKGSRPRVVRL